MSFAVISPPPSFVASVHARAEHLAAVFSQEAADRYLQVVEKGVKRAVLAARLAQAAASCADSEWSFLPPPNSLKTARSGESWPPVKYDLNDGSWVSIKEAAALIGHDTTTTVRANRWWLGVQPSGPGGTWYIQRTRLTPQFLLSRQKADEKARALGLIGGAE